MTRLKPIPLLLAGALLLAACCGPAVASDEDAAARALTEEVLRKAGSAGAESLGDWTRSVIERALERAGKTASETTRTPPSENGARVSAPPLPAERHASGLASGLAGRSNTAEVLIFMSLSVPSASWSQWAGEAAATGAPLVLRGVAAEGMRATVKAVGSRLGGHDAGVAIDPRLFRLFAIERVPAVVVVPGGVPACASRGCTDDPAPAHDRVSGNIGLAAALEAVAAEGKTGRETARRKLARLTGEAR